jgi:hypothetical protein
MDDILLMIDFVKFKILIKLENIKSQIKNIDMYWTIIYHTNYMLIISHYLMKNEKRFKTD